MKAYNVRFRNSDSIVVFGSDAKNVVKKSAPTGYSGTVSVSTPYGNEWKRFQVDSAGRVREIASYGK